jgi:hypothetical protein
VNKKMFSITPLIILIGSVALIGTAHFGVQASTDVSGIPKPSVPEFTVEYVDRSYDVPPTYEIDQYTGENVTVKYGYHVENRSIEFTFKNQPFAPYTDSSGNNIQLYYNFRFKGNYGEAWTYYPEDSNGRSVIHYGGGIQVDDTQLYPPLYPASNSDYTVVLLRLGLLGPPVGSQEIPDGVEVDFQAQALIGYFDRNDYGYYIFTGESSDWSNTQTITIGESQTPTPSPATTPTSTSPPSTTPTPTPYNEPQQTKQEVIIVAVVAAAVIGAGLGLLIYLIKRK